MSMQTALPSQKLLSLRRKMPSLRKNSLFG